MRWPAARITTPDRPATTRLLVFAAAELVLAMTIPFMLIRGYHTVLSSNAGTLVDSPTMTEPGWSALVSATPLSAVIEVVDGGVSGAALIVPPGDAPMGDTTVDDSEADPSGRPGHRGGTVVLIPGDLSMPSSAVTGSTRLFSDLDPVAAGEALEALLNIELVSVEVMNDTEWAQALTDVSYELDNPDPVPLAGVDQGAASNDDTGDTEDAPARLAFTVGPISVGGGNAAVFLGRPVEGRSLSSVMPRRQLFWTAMLEAPPAGNHPLASAVRDVGPAGQVVELPTIVTSDAPAIDASAAEDLLRDIVAFPSGNRLEIRLVDRSGHADLIAIAAQLAAGGVEVVEIANAVRFDDGSTEVIRPTELVDGVAQFDDLVARLGVEPIVDPEQEHDTVTMLVGSDFELAA